MPYRRRLFLIKHPEKTGAFIEEIYFDSSYRVRQEPNSCVAYAGVDLTEPKAAVQGTSYLSNLLDVSEAKLNLDEISCCTNKSFV